MPAGHTCPGILALVGRDGAFGLAHENTERPYFRRVAVLRNAGAVIAGLVVGMFVNLALVQLNTVFFPLPDGVDLTDSAQMRDAIRDLPAAAWILVFAAHLGQSFVGAWVAARLGASHRMALAMIVGAVSLGAGIANAMMLSAPAWTWLEMPFYLVVAWMAGRTAAPTRASAPARR